MIQPLLLIPSFFAGLHPSSIAFSFHSSVPPPLPHCPLSKQTLVLSATMWLHRAEGGKTRRWQRPPGRNPPAGSPPAHLGVGGNAVGKAAAEVACQNIHSPHDLFLTYEVTGAPSVEALPVQREHFSRMVGICSEVGGPAPWFICQDEVTSWSR